MNNVAEKKLPQIFDNFYNNIAYSNEITNQINKMSIIHFLGLKDKNGTNIKFGDILIDEMKNLLTPVIEIENAEHIFYFKPIIYLNKPQLKMGCKSTYSETLEIIGNVYTNPEILQIISNKNNNPKLDYHSKRKNLK